MSDTHRLTRCNNLKLIPTFDTREEVERFLHHDLNRIEPLQAWAERKLLAYVLAEITWDARRERSLVTPAGEMIPTSRWVRERIAALDQYLRPLRRNGAA